MGQNITDIGRMDFDMAQEPKKIHKDSHMKGNGRKVKNQVLVRYSIKMNFNSKEFF